jgi:DNA ligase-1
MSEKLDGMRAFWNCNTIISRHGKEFHCPSWFIEELPETTTLDGELWLERGTLELLGGILHSKQDNSLWKSLKFVVFDLPASKEPHESRLRDMAQLKLPEHVIVMDFERCKGNFHLQDRLQEILRQGGEGLMVNKPGSLYIAKRTSNLLKVKVNCFDNDLMFQAISRH